MVYWLCNDCKLFLFNKLFNKVLNIILFLFCFSVCIKHYIYVTKNEIIKRLSENQFMNICNFYMIVFFCPDILSIYTHPIELQSVFSDMQSVFYLCYVCNWFHTFNCISKHPNSIVVKLNGQCVNLVVWHEFFKPLQNWE